MPDPTRTYLDADVLLSYIEGDEERSADIEPLFDRGARGEVRLFTSTVSIVEVAFAKAEKDQRALSADVEAKIDNLWFPQSPIQLVEYTEFIGKRARRLVRLAMENAWKLKPMDAIHLSTAEYVEASVLHTYNAKDFKPFEEACALSVAGPEGGQGALPLVSEADAERNP